MPWRRFAVYDATAAVLWAAYGGGLGYAGGTAFEHEPLKGVALAFGLALAMAALFEAWRRRPRPRTPREETA
jgi:membrane protein DedA with SNARE-associated domain